MMLLDCLVYTFLTFIIPLKLTYQAFKKHKKLTAIHLWSSYWAIFSLIKLLQCQISFLSSQPMRIALLIFHLWLYYGDSRGALLLSSLARKKLNELGFLGYIDIIAQNLKIEDFLDIEDSKIKHQAVIHQNKKQK